MISGVKIMISYMANSPFYLFIYLFCLTGSLGQLGVSPHSKNKLLFKVGGIAEEQYCSLFKRQQWGF